MRKPLFFTGALLFLMTACQQPTKQSESRLFAPAARPQTVFKVMPLGKTDNGTIDQCVAALEKYAGKVLLLPAEKLPPYAYYAPRNRYRADSLIAWMNLRAGPGEVYVGITQVDISASKGGHKDFGIMGLGYNPGRACVVSSFRLKNKRNVYKVALHEAAHTAGLPHCPEKTCFVRDAMGGDPTGEETGFCRRCSAFLKNNGWRMPAEQSGKNS